MAKICLLPKICLLKMLQNLKVEELVKFSTFAFTKAFLSASETLDVKVGAFETKVFFLSPVHSNKSLYYPNAEFFLQSCREFREKNYFPCS